MQPVIEGRSTLADVLEQMKRDTRQFARRQRTWLRGVRGAVWMHPEERGAIEEAVERFLAPVRRRDGLASRAAPSAAPDAEAPAP
jgi:tRNA A37 N6-isopentenylltransferase MiaA